MASDTISSRGIFRSLFLFNGGNMSMVLIFSKLLTKMNVVRPDDATEISSQTVAENINRSREVHQLFQLIYVAISTLNY